MIKRLLPQPVKNILLHLRNCFRWSIYQQASWAQEGEDLIVDRYFESKPLGFYVDVGAHHPQRFSNTYKFYNRGWKGINIDAAPGSMGEFRRLRNRDINIEVPVSSEAKVLPFYIFNEPALNGFDVGLAEARNSEPNDYHIIKIEQLQAKRLVDILDEHLPRGQKIDFMNIDVEGHDLEVLKSNDWEKYRPEIVLVEILASSFSEVDNSEINNYLTGLDYELFAKAVNTVFYKDKFN